MQKLQYNNFGVLLQSHLRNGVRDMQASVMKGVDLHPLQILNKDELRIIIAVSPIQSELHSYYKCTIYFALSGFVFFFVMVVLSTCDTSFSIIAKLHLYPCDHFSILRKESQEKINT